MGFGAPEVVAAGRLHALGDAFGRRKQENNRSATMEGVAGDYLSLSLFKARQKRRAAGPTVQPRRLGKNKNKNKHVGGRGKRKKCEKGATCRWSIHWGL